MNINSTKCLILLTNMKLLAVLEIVEHDQLDCVCHQESFFSLLLLTLTVALQHPVYSLARLLPLQHTLPFISYTVPHLIPTAALLLNLVAYPSLSVPSSRALLTFCSLTLTFTTHPHIAALPLSLLGLVGQTSPWALGRVWELNGQITVCLESQPMLCGVVGEYHSGPLTESGSCGERKGKHGGMQRRWTSPQHGLQSWFLWFSGCFWLLVCHYTLPSSFSLSLSSIFTLSSTPTLSLSLLSLLPPPPLCS